MLSALLLGNAIYDERLMISGVSVNTPLFLALAALVWCLHIQPRDYWLIVALHAPIAFLIVSIWWSFDPEYGLSKIGNLLISSSIAALGLVGGIRAFGVHATLRVLLLCLAVLLAAALIYKLRFGFFDRGVPFLLNGPIIFARLMGIGVLLSLFVCTGATRLAATSSFGLATIWTFSKGPLLALVIVVCLYVLAKMPRHYRVASLAIFGLIVWSGLPLLATVDPAIAGRFSVFVELLTSGGSVLNAGGSLGNRVSIYADTMKVIVENPLGVGLGGWKHAVLDNQALSYPHNFFLEVFSEAGIVIGMLSVVPFFWFVANPRSVFAALALFLCFAQQFSGDLLDARYWLCFSVIAFWLRIDRGRSALQLSKSTNASNAAARHTSDESVLSGKVQSGGAPLIDEPS